MTQDTNYDCLWRCKILRQTEKTSRVQIDGKEKTLRPRITFELIQELDLPTRDQITPLGTAGFIAGQALLAIRDTQNRPDHPEIVNQRLKKIQKIIETYFSHACS